MGGDAGDDSGVGAAQCKAAVAAGAPLAPRAPVHSSRSLRPYRPRKQFAISRPPARGAPTHLPALAWHGFALALDFPRGGLENSLAFLPLTTLLTHGLQLLTHGTANVHNLRHFIRFMKN